MTDTAAAAPTMTTAIEPDGAPRVASLDILRGIAILGILFMNINDMGASFWAFFDNDIRHLGWSKADQIAWFVREVFANGTARCMLEMLFGVGMVILTDRAATAAGAAARAGRFRRIAGWIFGPAAVLKPYYARNIVLFLFGVVHMFVLLWPGDILHTYGLAALVAFLFRRLKPGWLLGVGLIMALMQFGFGGYDYLTRPAERARIAMLQTRQASGATLTKAETADVKKAVERKAERDERKAEIAKKIVAEDKARSGSFMTWTQASWDVSLAIQGKGLEILFVWEAAATMLIGAALYKWGVIQGRRSRRFYQWLMLGAYGIGLTSRAVSAVQRMRFDDQPNIEWPMYEIARLATTVGHISLVYLLLATVAGAKLLKPFEAAGRTALTVYICQTLICLWLLYPPFGFALYGKQGWMALMLTALAVNALLLWGANVYVRHYRIAPVEWLWRSIIARRWLPIRSGTVTDRPGAAPLAA